MYRTLCPAMLVAAIFATGCADPATGPDLAAMLQEEGESNPPPPPVEGAIVFEGAGGGDDAAGTSASFGARANAMRDCDLPIFCVPGRYFLSKTENNEWLDFVHESPLPAEIKEMLKETGAACGVGSEGETLFCPVESFAQGQIFEKPDEMGGHGLAYDVSSDGRFVTTIALDQFDNMEEATLNCVEARGQVFCQTPPVFAETWVDVSEGGPPDYRRGTATPGTFRYVGGTPDDIICEIACVDGGQ